MMTASIGRYVIHDVLGVGGMGVVCRAEDLTLRRAVALKFLAADLASDEEYRARFFREARVAASLNHPNTCVVYEVGEVDSPITLPTGNVVAAATPFIAMELIEGGTLEARLAEGTRLPVGTAVEIALQLAEGLAEAHAGKIIHRDLKPQNVMTTRAGRVKIVDFGLAKPVGPIHGAKTRMSTSEMISADIGTAAVIGTCAYMSPEQATGKPLDARSDIFAFGVLLYQMIAGRLPFQGDTPTETIAKILEAEPSPLPAADAPTDRSRAFEQIVLRCLQKKPEDRYPDARELLRDLREIQSTEQDISPPADVAHDTWHARAASAGRRRWVVVAAIGVLGVLASWPFLSRPELEGEDSAATRSSTPAEQVVQKGNLLPGPGPTAPAPGSDQEQRDQPEGPLPLTPSSKKPSTYNSRSGRMGDPLREDEPATAGALLNVNSSPRASVTIDGNLIGVTPLVLKTEPGTHEILLTGPDGLRWSGRVDVAAQQVHTVHPNLHATGSLSIVSDVWAEVSLDDGPPEQTPIHFPRIATGLHSLRVSRQGYVTQVLEIFIEEGKASSIKVTLKRQP